MPPAEEDFFSDGDAPGDTRVLLVWPDLLQAVAVYTRCVMAVGGMAGASMGLPASEVLAALKMLQVPRAEWEQISADVSAMGHLAANGINARAKAR